MININIDYNSSSQNEQTRSPWKIGATQSSYTEHILAWCKTILSIVNIKLFNNENNVDSEIKQTSLNQDIEWIRYFHDHLLIAFESNEANLNKYLQAWLR